MRALLQDRLPALPVFVSHKVSPEARQFDRLCTTVANTCIQPLMSRYLERFAARFAEQGLVLSCTDMRSVEIIARLERATGKPVVGSNRAMAFSAMQALGIDDPMKGFGQLLERTRR